MGIQMNAPAKVGCGVERINTHGERFVGTLKRNEQLVYDALRQSRTPLKAYDLLEELQDHGLRAPMTIYRALDALIAKECVTKIESLNAFVALDCDARPRARAFLICRQCMQAKEITLDEQQVTAMFSPIEVSAGDVRIEAFGDCHQVCGPEKKS